VEWCRGLVRVPQPRSLAKEVNLGARSSLITYQDGCGAYIDKLRKNLRCSVARQTAWSDKNDGISRPSREVLLVCPLLDICGARELLWALEELGSFARTRRVGPGSNVSHHAQDRQLIRIGTAWIGSAVANTNLIPCQYVVVRLIQFILSS